MEWHWSKDAWGERINGGEFMSVFPSSSCVWFGKVILVIFDVASESVLSTCGLMADRYHPVAQYLKIPFLKTRIETDVWRRSQGERYLGQIGIFLVLDNIRTRSLPLFSSYNSIIQYYFLDAKSLRLCTHRRVLKSSTTAADFVYRANLLFHAATAK